jgi:hypothetical protein
MRPSKVIFYGIFLLLIGFTLFPEIPYGTGTWDAATLGNHRVVVHVAERTDAVAVHIPWRRRDYNPEKKRIIVTDAKTGKQVLNVYFLDINREYGNLMFRPHTVPGDYYIYYLPYTHTGSKHYPKVNYLEPEKTASEEWLQKHRLTSAASAREEWKQLGKAEVLEFQSIDQFNSFYPMEVIAVKREVKDLIANHPDKSYLLFPEDREFPIRMTRDLPRRWIKNGPRNHFKGRAARGEFYAFQIGLYAFKAPMPNIEVFVTMIKNTKNILAIPPIAMHCINIGGVDWTGKRFVKECPVEKGQVQPLWFYLDVPEQLMAGEYEGTITIRPRGFEAQAVKFRLTVTDEIRKDAGDNEPWRHSRLHWLDSTIALDYDLVPPFTKMKVKKERDGLMVSCLGRKLTVDRTGFPVSIRSSFSPDVTHIHKGLSREILASPIKLIVEGADGNVLPWQAKGVTQTLEAAAGVGWTARNKTAAAGLIMDCMALMEMDGFVEFKVALQASRDIDVNDIRLEIPIVKEVARYMMGLGLKGGYRPAGYKWKWDVKKNQDSAWLGDVNAGLHYSLRGANYSRPLNTNFYQLKPLNMPVSWSNEGKGGIDIFEQGDIAVVVKAYSGKRTLKAGETLHFNFNLLITPFKPLDTAGQWKHRFFHRFKPLKEIAATGANTVNVHHATEINPFINYPFLRPKEMKAYIDEAHDMGMKVKIYYTVRELSNFAPELFALRSLGDEILSYGPGGGFAWLQEHLGGNYIAGWLVPDYKDAAVINSGVSRWHNYYLEGLNWLVKNVGIDGLYIDDVAFDRTVMKRVRKILDTGGNGALIDLHSANQFNPRDGFANSANLYLEHFPYINRLWFGEYFDYNSQPDFWLVEVSGIPFGLMGEMLQDGGNPWRGMVYGMTNRLPWAGDPTPLWKAWDDFGIKDSRMIGYWSSNCPVKTDHKDVLATAYVKKGEKTMVAVAGWAKEDLTCKLLIDWKALGLKPNKVKLTAPHIENFQSAAVFNCNDDIPIPQGKGWLLIIENKK